MHHPRNVTRYLLVVGARVTSDVRWPAWKGLSAAMRWAESSPRALQARRRRHRAPSQWLRAALHRATSAQADGIELATGERRTLEFGSVVVLSTLGLGLQVGSWPAWSAPVAVCAYLGWVVLYSEVTVRASRPPSAARRPSETSVAGSSKSEAPPT